MNKNTKEHIADVFLNLINSKSIEQVTVVEICQQAHISRDAFYYYFDDKYDLIRWIYHNQKVTIMNQYFGQEPWSETVLRVLKLIKKFSTFYRRGFADTHYQSLEQTMIDIFFKMSEEEMLKHSKAEKLTEEMKFFMSFNSHGAVEMTKEWVESGMRMPEEKLAKLLAAAMPQQMKEIWDTFQR